MCQYANWLRYVYAVPSRRRSLTHYHIGTLLSVKQLEGEFATNFLILPVCKAGKQAKIKKYAYQCHTLLPDKVSSEVLPVHSDTDVRSRHTGYISSNGEAEGKALRM